MILRDALDIRRGTAQRNKIYKGTYKVWDRNKIALEGYCKQETTKGRNLLDISLENTTLNGVDIAYDEKTGILTLNGTATSSGTLSVRNTDFLTLLGGFSYTISLRVVSGSYTYNTQEAESSSIQIWKKWNKNFQAFFSNIVNNFFTQTRNLTEDVIYDTLQIKVAVGDVFNDFKIQVQLEKGVTYSEFEKYTGGHPSPNPDYPQEIEVMQGRQVVNIKSKNELNYDLEPENKYYDMNGQPVTISGAVYVNQTINLLANTTYTFSYEEKIGDAIVRLCEYKEDGTFIKRTLIQNNNVSVTLDNKTSYVITSTNKAPTSMFIKPQIQEGSTATPWVPYKNEQYTVDLKSKNLLNLKNMISSTTLNGIEFVNNGDGTFNVSGTATANADLVIADVTEQIKKLQKNKNYYFYSSVPYDLASFNFTLRLRTDASPSTKYFTPTSPMLLNENWNISQAVIVLWVGSGSTVDTATNVKTMFVQSNIVDNDYEPYYDYKLAGIGDYKDNFYTDKGKWYFKKNIGNGVLDGNNEWLQLSGSSYGYFNRNLMEDRARGLDVLLSNYFLQIPAVRGVGMYNGQGNIIFCVEDIQTPEDFKTWLQAHTVIVYYRLANAIITEIPSTYTTLINQLNALYQAM